MKFIFISRWAFQHFQSDYLDIRTEDSVVRSQLCGQWDLRFVVYLGSSENNPVHNLDQVCQYFLSGETND